MCLMVLDAVKLRSDRFWIAIERGRERTEHRLIDRNERGEMYRLIDEFRTARGLSVS